MNRHVQFVHIPKCAGMAFNSAVVAAIGDAHARIFYGNEEVQALWQVRWDRTEWEFEREYLDFRQCLLQTYLNRGYHYIGGHLPFSPLAENLFKDRYDFITVLRHPVERFESHIAHLVLRKGHQPPEAYVSGEADPVPEAEKLLARDDFCAILANQISIALGGLNYRCRVELENRRPHAIAALAKMALVGFQDAMSDFVARFAERYAVELQLPALNRQQDALPDPQARNRLQDLFESRRKSITRLCETDLAVYEHAREHASP